MPKEQGAGVTPPQVGRTPLRRVGELCPMPSERAGTVVHQSILDRLTDPDRPRVVSIVAPAGYGKSTLLGQWADRVPRAVYLRLDEGDDDPVELPPDIADAFRNVDLIEEEVLERIPAPGSMPSHLGFRCLMDALSHLRNASRADAGRRPSCDLEAEHRHHRLAHGARAAVDATRGGRRTATAIPTARLSVHDQLLRVEADDLRFGPDHTREMAVTMGTRLSPLDVVKLKADGRLARCGLFRSAGEAEWRHSPGRVTSAWAPADRRLRPLGAPWSPRPR